MNNLQPDKLLALKMKIAEIHPGILVWRCRHGHVHAEHVNRCPQCEYLYSDRKVTRQARPIRLADVLLAAQINAAFQMSGHVLLHQGNLAREYGSWNLRSDSLDSQSEETIFFLHSLLCQ